MYKNIIEKKYVGLGNDVNINVHDNSNTHQSLVDQALLIKRTITNTNIIEGVGLSLDLSCDTGVETHDNSSVPDAKIELVSQTGGITDGAENFDLNFIITKSGTLKTKASITPEGLILHSNTKKSVTISPSDDQIPDAYTLTLPVDNGDANQVLTTDGDGVLTWTISSGTTINNNADNRIITGSGTSSTLEAEANLTFDGIDFNVICESTNINSNLNVNGDTITGKITSTGFIGDLTGTADTATVATTVTITDNESINENNAIIFTSGADVDGGNIGLGSDGTLTYNPSTGKITASGFVGDLTGNASGSSGTCTGNAATATALATAINIGGVAFDGSAAIILPGVNDTGNQNTTGNAATATALETFITIGGVAFNGSENIDLPGPTVSSSNIGYGYQDTTGNDITLTGYNVNIITHLGNITETQITIDLGEDGFIYKHSNNSAATILGPHSLGANSYFYHVTSSANKNIYKMEICCLETGTASSGSDYADKIGIYFSHTNLGTLLQGSDIDTSSDHASLIDYYSFTMKNGMFKISNNEQPLGYFYSYDESGNGNDVYTYSDVGLHDVYLYLVGYSYNNDGNLSGGDPVTHNAGKIMITLYGSDF